MVSTLLASPYALQSPCMTVQSACASATQAIGESFSMIRHGEADVMVDRRRRQHVDGALRRRLHPGRRAVARP